MKFDALKQYLSTLPDTQIPCIDLAVFHKGQEVFRYTSGTCDYLRQKPVGEDTLYWIYSMTKPITMTAVMQCVERGLIGLDDAVSKYIPAFEQMNVLQEDGSVRPAKETMTVRHLMSMSGGLDYDLKKPAMLEAMRDKNASTETIVNAIAAAPLCFEPGTSFKYSLCHDVAARVVEVATGMRFGEYLQKNIFDKLGMKDTSFRDTPERRARLAAQFKRDEAHDCLEIYDFCNRYALSDAYESGGAGLITSAADYGKFVSAMSTAFTDESPLLGQAAINEMRRPQLSDEILEKRYPKYVQGYSYGLGVRTMLHPEREDAKSPIGEFGWDGAAGSMCMIDPDNQIAMCYLTQVMSSRFSYFELLPKVRDLIYSALK